MFIKKIWNVGVIGLLMLGSNLIWADDIPIVELSPGAFDFGNQPLNITVEDTETITLTNTGDAELQDILIEIMGTGKDEFQLLESTCGESLPAGESCQIDFTFAPTTSGKLEARLTVTSNAESSPDEVILKGTGGLEEEPEPVEEEAEPVLVSAEDQPVVSLSPTSLDFGEQPVNETSKQKTVTLKNTGKAELKSIRITIGGSHKKDFASLDSSTCEKTLAAGKNCKINLTFTPSAEGAREATLTVSSNADTSPDEIMLKGIGMVDKPTVSLSSSTLDFKNQTVKETSNQQTVTLKNTGKGELTNIGIKIGGTHSKEFSQLDSSSCEKTLAAGKSCKINLTFTPKAAGEREATLTVTSNAESSPDEIVLKGTGIEEGKPDDAPKLNVTSTIVDFGNHAVSVLSDEEMVTLKNVGKGALKNLKFTIEGANQDDFATPTTPCDSNLAVDQDCTISITFTPTDSGVREATLIVTSNANSSPDEITLKGTGIPDDEPIVRLMPTYLDFGEQIIDETSTETTVSLTNKGQVELTDIQITIEGDHPNDFAQVAGTCESTLEAGESCEISVTFTPTAEGSREATLNVYSNASTSPDSISLQGSGKIAIQYAGLGKAFAFDAEGNVVETTVEFSGGVSVVVEDENGEALAEEFKSALEINLEQPVVFSSVLTSIPEDHIGQQADIIVIAFYVREIDAEGNNLLKTDSASDENCDPSLVSSVNEGGYYMVQRKPDIYCDWIVEGGVEGWCIDDVPDARTTRQKLESPEEYFELWSGNLADLKALETVTLSDPLELSEEAGNSIYKGKIDGTGHVCVYLGYQSSDGTLVFNGEGPITLRIRE